MKDKEIEQLIEKYEAGDSSLQEEQFLFDNAENSKIEAWSAFAQRNKVEAPNHFNDNLWESFQKRTIKKRRFKIRIISAAASIILIIALSVGNLGEKELTYNEKADLLAQALSMFPDTEQEVAQKSIIYEDDIVVIYASVE